MGRAAKKPDAGGLSQVLLSCVRLAAGLRFGHPVVGRLSRKNIAVKFRSEGMGFRDELGFQEWRRGGLEKRGPVPRRSSPRERDDDPEQPERGDGHDRKRDGEQHFDDDNRGSPVDANGFLRTRRIPTARLVANDDSAKAASSRRPIPLCVPHSASIAWS